jgi:hypothetical protein
VIEHMIEASGADQVVRVVGSQERRDTVVEGNQGVCGGPVGGDRRLAHNVVKSQGGFIHVARRHEIDEGVPIVGIGGIQAVGFKQPAVEMSMITNSPLALHADTR